MLFSGIPIHCYKSDQAIQFIAGKHENQMGNGMRNIDSKHETKKKEWKKKQFFFIKFKKSNSSRVKRWMLCFFQANKNSIKTEQRNQFDWESKWIDLVELMGALKTALNSPNYHIIDVTQHNHNTFDWTMWFEKWSKMAATPKKYTSNLFWRCASSLLGENGTRPKGLRSLLIYKIKFTVTQLFAILCICLFSFSGSILKNEVRENVST